VLTSHNFVSPPLLTKARTFPSGLKAMPSTSLECPLKVATGSSVSTSHSFTVVFKPAAISFPSGLNAMQYKSSPGLRTLIKFPVSISKSLILFLPATASVFPSGLNSTARVAYPVSVLNFFPLSISMISILSMHILNFSFPLLISLILPLQKLTNLPSALRQAQS